jgi:DNA polymerase-3 subunit delta
LARQIASSSGNDRGVIGQEVSKYALYLDASPVSPKELTSTAIEALSAAYDEGDIGRLVNAVLDGRGEAVAHEMTLAGAEPVRILNQLLARLLLLARLRSAVEAGARPAQVIENNGRAIFWKDKPVITQQLQRWSGARLATVHERLLAVRRAVMTSTQMAPLRLQSELIVIARVAARLR